MTWTQPRWQTESLAAPDLIPVSDRRRFDALAVRQLAELDRLEELARAARVRHDHRFGWAPMSMDTGLSPAQEEFVLTWSPERVLRLCDARRTMIRVLRAQIDQHEPGAVDLATTVLLAFGGESRPGSIGEPADRG